MSSLKEKLLKKAEYYLLLLNNHNNNHNKTGYHISVYFFEATSFSPDIHKTYDSSVFTDHVSEERMLDLYIYR